VISTKNIAKYETCGERSDIERRVKLLDFASGFYWCCNLRVGCSFMADNIWICEGIWSDETVVKIFWSRPAYENRLDSIVLISGVIALITETVRNGGKGIYREETY
jgi:hypothetical protein